MAKKRRRKGPRPGRIAVGVVVGIVIGVAAVGVANGVQRLPRRPSTANERAAALGQATANVVLILGAAIAGGIIAHKRYS